MTRTAYSDDVSPEVRRRRRARMARKILPGQRSLNGCGRAMISAESGVVVRVSAPGAGGEHGVSFSGVRRCGSVWLCPDCAAAVSERRACELEAAATAWTDKGHSCVLLTLTHPHSVRDSLLDLHAAGRAAMKDFRGAYVYKEAVKDLQVLGTVRCQEVTVGKGSGWHPHFHMLFFIWGTASAVQLAAFKSAVFSAWLKACVGNGLEAPSPRFGVDLVSGVTVADRLAAYLAKFGTEPKVKRGVEREMAKSHTKRARGHGDRFAPFALLDEYERTGEKWFFDRFLEYALTFKGARQLFWSPGLKSDLAEFVGAQFDDRSDAEIAEAHRDPSAVVYEEKIRPVDWVAVNRAGLYADLVATLALAAALSSEIGADVRSGSASLPSQSPCTAALQAVIEAAHDTVRQMDFSRLKRLRADLAAWDDIPSPPHVAA